MSETHTFDLKAEREWLDQHPKVTAVNVNAYVAALNEIARLMPVYDAAKAMQSGIGDGDRSAYRRVDAVCVAVEIADGKTPPDWSPSRRGATP